MRVSITGDSDGLSRATRDAEGKLDRLNKAGGRVSRGLGTLGSVAKTGVVAGFVAAGAGAKIAYDEFREAERVSAQTEAALKSTGHAAGLTKQDIEDLAGSISRKTAIDDEQIQSGENLLLTFTNVRNEVGKGNDIFSQATSIMTDMSVALGQDTKSSAIQLGKALNDPVKGVTALQRVGVSFTQQQRDQIQAMVDSGKTMDAQKLILRELNKEFGGSAQAAATPMDHLRTTLANVAEVVGSQFVPVLDEGAKFLAEFVEQIQSGTGAGGKFADAVKVYAHVVKIEWDAIANAVRVAVAAVGGWLRKNRDDIAQLGKAFQNIGKGIAFVFEEAILPVVKRVLPAVLGALRGFVQLAKGIVEVFTGLFTGDFRKMWQGVKDIFGGGIRLILAQMRLFTAPMREIVHRIGQAIRGTFERAWDAVKNVFQAGVRLTRQVLKNATAPQREAARGIAKAIVAAFDLVKEVPGRVIGFLSSLPEKLFNLGVRAASRMAAGIGTLPGKLKDALSAVAGIAASVGEAIRNWVNDHTLFGDHVHVGIPGPVPDVDFTLPALARGGRVDKPMVMVGEEAPRHDEFVIATNPAYRRENVGYLAQAAAALGIPGFKKGKAPKSPKMGAGRWETDKKTGLWYAPTMREALRFPIEELETELTEAQSTYDSAKGGARARALVDLRRIQGTVGVARKQAARVKKHEDLAEIARQKMELASQQGNRGRYGKAKHQYLHQLREQRRALQFALAQTKRRGPYWRELTLAIGSLDQAIDTAKRDEFPEAEAATADEAPTELDALEAAMAEAGLTEGTDDDITAADALIAYRERALAWARAHGDPRLIKQAADDLAAARSTREALDTEDAGPSQDQTAERERADLRAYIQTRANALNAAFGYTASQSGDLGYTVQFNTVFPPTPEMARQAAAGVVAGLGYQGSVTSSRERVA